VNDASILVVVSSLISLILLTTSIETSGLKKIDVAIVIFILINIVVAILK